MLYEACLLSAVICTWLVQLQPAGNKNEESDGDGDAVDAEVDASRPKDSKKDKNKKIAVATHKLQYKPFTASPDRPRRKRGKCLLTTCPSSSTMTTRPSLSTIYLRRVYY